ncbi:Aste57867_544 [Aphanomyces stellatus]|uniref:Aste57867_544 protein n=1 Tax=Aphanomyces stellatus TaxID=120398 RepID=A0A485K3W3_9STRA|nr:hypothetical protein As57867_000543 [Aphanomyces stellatus]VFT77769.1 Aste57867_544 [Aphanomyces stellatus]
MAPAEKPRRLSATSRSRSHRSLETLVELEWFRTTRRPILFLVYLFHGLSSLNFAIIAIIMLRASPVEAKSISLYHQNISGGVYIAVAFLHATPLLATCCCCCCHRPTKPRVSALANGPTDWMASFPLPPQPFAGRGTSWATFPPHASLLAGRVIRMICQTWAAFDMARRFTDTRTSFAYSMIVVFSCLLTSWTLLLKCTPHQAALLNFLQSVLAFFVSSGVPLLAIVVPIVTYFFSGTAQNEPHDYVWLGRTVSSTRIIVVTQPHQLVLNVTLSALNFVALRHVAAQLQSNHPSSVAPQPLVSSNAPQPPMATTPPRWASVPAAQATRHDSTQTRVLKTVNAILTTGIQQLRVDHEHKRFLRFVFAVDFIWSLTIFGLSTSAHAFRSPCPAHCILESAPWFTNTCNCIYARVDCNATSQDPASALTADLLGPNLLILHTRQCHLPHGLAASVFAPFQSLYAFDLEFTAMEDWDMPSSDLPASLLIVQIRYSQLKFVPLVLHNASSSWSTLYLTGAPIGDIPPWILDNWANLGSLWLSETNMTFIPPTILHMPYLETLAVDGNNLSSIPPELASRLYLRNLYLDRNNIATFPTALVLANPSVRLSLNHNPIQDIPSSVWPRLGPLVDVASTPFCSISTSAHQLGASVCALDCATTCSRSHRGNYLCDLSCNTTECGYDGGDCIGQSPFLAR